VVLTCADVDAAAVDHVLDPGAARTVPVTGRPGRADVDPLLETPELTGGGRLVVVGTDADLAAVLVRLLRRERLDVALAFVPVGPSEAAAVWGVPGQLDAALALARDGRAGAVPLVRDDRGGVVVGSHVVGAFDGVVYCDEHEVLRGQADSLVVRPDPDGGPPERGGVAVTVTGRRRLGGLRAGAAHAARGRAATIGCRPARVVRDGVDEQTLERRSWYRHTSDWTLVRRERDSGHTP
jgi:hypothetical protein